MMTSTKVALAGSCTLAASLICVSHIYMHLRNYTEPTYQRYTVRIIFMVHVRKRCKLSCALLSLPWWRRSCKRLPCGWRKNPNILLLLGIMHGMLSPKAIEREREREREKDDSCALIVNDDDVWKHYSFSQLIHAQFICITIVKDFHRWYCCLSTKLVGFLHGLQVYAMMSFLSLVMPLKAIIFSSILGM